MKFKSKFKLKLKPATLAATTLISLPFIAVTLLLAAPIGKALALETAKKPRDSAPLEIKDRFFIALCDDIMTNPRNYAARKIKLAGIYAIFQLSDDAPAFTNIIRRAPGCCGDDGYIGFEVICPANQIAAQPGDWVEGIGSVEPTEETGLGFARLRLDTLEVLPKRGKEFVTQ